MKKKFRHWILIICGFISVGLGALGIFLPLLPTTPFLLLAAACFIRSSDRLYTWMITNRIFGSYIKNYREKKAVPGRIKVFTLILLWAAIGYSAVMVVQSFWMRAGLVLIAIGVTWHVLTLKPIIPERKQVENEREGEGYNDKGGAAGGR